MEIIILILVLTSPFILVVFGIMTDVCEDISRYRRRPLSRFAEAQGGGVYERALSELRAGCKQTHWMWFVFPQLSGFGDSRPARIYGIHDLDEASAYLADGVLGARLRECCAALLALKTSDPRAVFGSPADLKLRSCMTLFDYATPYEPLFDAVLEKFFGARACYETERRLARRGELSCDGLPRGEFPAWQCEKAFDPAGNGAAFVKPGCYRPNCSAIADRTSGCDSDCPVNGARTHGDCMKKDCREPGCPYSVYARREEEQCRERRAARAYSAVVKRVRSGQKAAWQ
ncbi:MAG: DUF1810 domain-containing protein [Oscillospiraceae bacterium]|jgi:uncharacterized protein (DUF1810 family)|nr:DUF1810 domain-containing protein [Oscillospiraceae bacterium]